MVRKKKYDVSIYEYRCRRCQNIYSNTIEGWFQKLVCDMLNLNHLTNPEEEKEVSKELGIEIGDKAPLYDIHICKDGGRGLSDLIGCEPPREVSVLHGEWEEKYRTEKQEVKTYNF